jgi:hypothetical protein
MLQASGTLIVQASSNGRYKEKVSKTAQETQLEQDFGDLFASSS